MGKCFQIRRSEAQLTQLAGSVYPTRPIPARCCPENLLGFQAVQAEAFSSESICSTTSWWPDVSTHVSRRHASPSDEPWGKSHESSRSSQTYESCWCEKANESRWKTDEPCGWTTTNESPRKADEPSRLFQSTPATSVSKLPTTAQAKQFSRPLPR